MRLGPARTQAARGLRICQGLFCSPSLLEQHQAAVGVQRGAQLAVAAVPAAAASAARDAVCSKRSQRACVSFCSFIPGLLSKRRVAFFIQSRRLAKGRRFRLPLPRHRERRTRTSRGCRMMCLSTWDGTRNARGRRVMNPAQRARRCGGSGADLAANQHPAEHPRTRPSLLVECSHVPNAPCRCIQACCVAVRRHKQCRGCRL